MLSFMQVLWPEFSVWHLYAGVLSYQKNYHTLQVKVFRGATEQSTLAKRGKFHKNSIPILRVDYSYAYNNLLKRLRFLGNKK